MRKNSFILKIFLLTTIFFNFFITPKLFSEEYQIQSVEYHITGRTKEYPLSLNIPVDTTIVFDSIDSYNSYISLLKKDFLNQRVLESVTIDSIFLEKSDPTKPIQVQLIIYTVDSWNFIAFPYPKYDSNDGLSLKLKAKDYNFLGSMDELECELMYFSEIPTYTDKYLHTIPLEYDTGKGIAATLSFDYPFKIGSVDSSWTNTITGAYVFGADAPYVVSGNGLNFKYPINTFSIDFNITETYTYNSYYEDDNDSSYTTTDFTISLPFTLYNSDRFGKFILTPFTNLYFNADSDILKDESTCLGMQNTTLADPELAEGVTLGISNINWINNFRKGISEDSTIKAIQLLESNSLHPEVQVTSTAFYPFNHFALNGRITAFYNFSNTDTRPAGYYMRGILDTDNYVSKAFILNLDIPFSLFTTNWHDMNIPISHYLDFELQVSPFIDIALCSSDNYYLLTSGFEIIAFPLKMRSIQVRGSIGFNLTDINDISEEVYIGLGLFY
jgi:hypothetical protein